MRTAPTGAVLLASVAWFAAGAAAQTPPRTIEKGEQSGISEPTSVVVRDTAAWRQLWERHAPDRPVPSVDFTKESVVALFLGTRATPGYNVTILSTTEGGGALIVRYRETRPAPRAILAQVITSPYHIVAVAKVTAANVRFEKAE